MLVRFNHPAAHVSDSLTHSGRDADAIRALYFEDERCFALLGHESLEYWSLFGDRG